MRRLLLLAAMLVAAGVIAACGGSGDGDSDGADSTDESASVTRAEFIEMADAICAVGDEAQNELQAELQSATSPEQAADVYERLADRSEETIGEISGLPKPEGDEQAIEELAAVQAEGVELVRALAEAVRANDMAQGEEVIAQLQETAASGDRGDEAFGFKVC